MAPGSIRTFSTLALCSLLLASGCTSSAEPVPPSGPDGPLPAAPSSLKSGNPEKDVPLVDCEGLGLQTLPYEHVRVRLQPFHTDCAWGRCGDTLEIEYEIFIPYLRKLLTRVPGCERCELIGFQHLLLRNAVVHARKVATDDGSTRLMVDHRFEPTDIVLEETTFSFQRPGEDIRDGRIRRLCEAEVGCMGFWED